MATGNGSQKEQLKVGFIPGTGRMGFLLAGHLARAGFSVYLGSRSDDKGRQAAKELLASCPDAQIQGGSNYDVAAWADTVFWSPNGSLQDREALLRSLAANLENKVIIDVSNVLFFFGESEWGQTSSVLLNQAALGVPARWTTAFKATSSKHLEELPDPQNPHHTFVAGDDAEAVERTIALVESIPGFKGIKAGSLANSKIVELLGPLWLFELDKLNTGGNFQCTWRFGV